MLQMYVEGTLGITENILQGAFASKQNQTLVNKNIQVFRSWWAEVERTHATFQESTVIQNYGVFLRSMLCSFMY